MKNDEYTKNVHAIFWSEAQGLHKTSVRVFAHTIYAARSSQLFTMSTSIVQ